MRPGWPAAACATILLLAAASAGASDETSWAPVPQDAAEHDRLEHGALIVRVRDSATGSGIAVLAAGVVDAPPARVWPVLRDCQRYEEFLPRVEHSARRVEDGRTICVADIDLPFPLRDIHSETRVENVELPDGMGYERRWVLWRGNYRHNEGTWTLHPWGAAAARTLAVYRVDVDIGRFVPDFLQRLVQRRTAAELFGAVRRRALAPPSG